jgi:hypothetical protein
MAQRISFANDDADDYDCFRNLILPLNKYRCVQGEVGN